ncbi:hypothetical protein B0H13DRAFT_1891943 [Mycena leptocephala]|nr:hypothetical protein B0H13DRAFT_1891943 [Mycena leptocephala]
MDSTCSSPESPTTVTLSEAVHSRLGAIMLAECTQRHATSIYMAAPFNFLGAVLPLDEKVLGANPRDVYCNLPPPPTSPAIKIGSAFNLYSRAESDCPSNARAARIESKAEEASGGTVPHWTPIDARSLIASAEFRLFRIHRPALEIDDYGHENAVYTVRKRELMSMMNLVAGNCAVADGLQSFECHVGQNVRIAIPEEFGQDIDSGLLPPRSHHARY